MVKRTRRIKRTKKYTRKHKHKRTGGGIPYINRLLQHNSITKGLLGVEPQVIKSGAYGTFEKACIKNGNTETCFGIKYVSPNISQNTENTKTLELTKKVLEHEIEIMIELKDVINTVIDDDSIIEIKNHTENYMGSIIPDNLTPILLTEYIDGFTLDSNKLPEDITNNIISYYFQLMLVLRNINNYLSGFVHADLHGGNIFFTKRLSDHPECHFKIWDSSIEDNKEVVFNNNYVIRIIDFGLSETDKIRKPTIVEDLIVKQSYLGLWQLDAFMALKAFYIATPDTNPQKTKLKEICKIFFGEEITILLDDNEQHIYDKISLLTTIFERDEGYNYDEFFKLF
jgi:hypothetical protein